jgi:hypothetical protein
MQHLQTYNCHKTQTQILTATVVTLQEAADVVSNELVGSAPQQMCFL